MCVVFSVLAIVVLSVLIALILIHTTTNANGSTPGGGDKGNLYSKCDANGACLSSSYYSIQIGDECYCQLKPDCMKNSSNNCIGRCDIENIISIIWVTMRNSNSYFKWKLN